MNQKKKRELVDSLRAQLRDMLDLRAAGGSHARLAHAVGRIDGIMQALCALGLATQRELLDVVAQERCRRHGSATQALELDEVEISAAV